MPILHDQLHIVVFQANADHHDSIQAVQKCGTRAHRDQGVHTRCAGLDALPTADEECAVDPADGQRQRQLHQRKHHGTTAMALHERGQRQADHMPHRDIHQRHQKAQAGDQALFQFGGLGVLQLGVFAVGGSQAGAVTGSLHGIADALGRRVRVSIGGVVYLHRVGQQAYGHTSHTRHSRDRFFHMAGTSRTAHAGDLIALHGSSIAPLLKMLKQ